MREKIPDMVLCIVSIMARIDFMVVIMGGNRAISSRWYRFISSTRSRIR
ncbi:Uncharacterised protein [Mycobacteroides abscessus subsp. massiliense]|nr:Uncharacterised protein [Mycobacteroides abscessus]SIL96067.1 Uncharacterised protein [Mycobacteroides abscessus subsp. abscessus]SKG43607.1 Uncharacterised protein [Mycobacteroides abscessus subsp. massiliense]CPU67860.1 Uncharacterised protein [Mycobacteroides abscessus]CPX89008.1 Uncharacterised protein [Mycobacteroides abscessus]